MKHRLVGTFFGLSFSTFLAACADPVDPAISVVGDDGKVLRFLETGVEVSLREDESYTITFDDVRQLEVDQPSFRLLLAGGAFDPKTQAPPADVPGLDDLPARDVDRPALYIVQFATQPLPEYRLRLVQLGAGVHQYFPEHAQIVRMTGAIAEKVRQEPFVRWVGELRPSWRLDAGLRRAFAARESLPTARYWLHGLDDGRAAKQGLADRLTQLGATVHTVPSGGYLVQVSLSQAQLAAVTDWDDVLYVDPWSAPEDDLDIAREIDGANYVEGVAGYTGQGVEAEVMDGNVLETHGDFASRPLKFHGVRSTGSKFHGTATTGIVFGDGTGDRKGRGMLPSAQGYFASYETVTDRYAHTKELLEEPWQALFQSNSWGDARVLTYTTISADMDKLLFDHDILILQSQSNSGTQMSRPQAWAKNVLSVGAVNHFDTPALTDDKWAQGASIGPAADGRIKPDLSHFYDATWAPSWSGTYEDFGGTSGATPITAGYAGLFYQMWGAGLFGPTRPGETLFEKRPHATTAKAMLINTAKPYAFAGATHDLTRTHQGWGHPDARRLYDLRGKFYIVDESDILVTAGRTAHRVEVAAGTPELRATLTWADPPAVPLAARTLVNDLTLRVVSPSGVEYFGNVGLREGNVSTPGGAADTIDTVENVWIATPEAGTWTVEVIATALNQDGHVETPAVDADYALVVSGANRAGEEPPMGHLVFAQVAYDMPGNDTLQEWVELYNPTAMEVDLGGWKIRDDFRTFTFPAGTKIGAGKFLDVARDGAAFQALTGKQADVAGMICSLGNTGDRLTLVDPAGQAVDFVAWEQGWPGWETLATKRGRALHRRRPDVDTDVRADWTVRDPAPRGGRLGG
jgi:hypothetical protein